MARGVLQYKRIWAWDIRDSFRCMANRPACRSVLTPFNSSARVPSLSPCTRGLPQRISLHRNMKTSKFKSWSALNPSRPTSLVIDPKRRHETCGIGRGSLVSPPYGVSESRLQACPKFGVQASAAVQGFILAGKQLPCGR